VHPIQVPTNRFSHVHIDLMGPLLVAEDGSTYILTMVDGSTRLLEAVPLSTMEAKVCAPSLCTACILEKSLKNASLRI